MWWESGEGASRPRVRPASKQSGEGGEGRGTALTTELPILSVLPASPSLWVGHWGTGCIAWWFSSLAAHRSHLGSIGFLGLQWQGALGLGLYLHTCWEAQLAAGWMLCVLLGVPAFLSHLASPASAPAHPAALSSPLPLMCTFGLQDLSEHGKFGSGSNRVSALITGLANRLITRNEKERVEAFGGPLGRLPGDALEGGLVGFWSLGRVDRAPGQGV